MRTSDRAMSKRWLELGEQQRGGVADAVVSLVSEHRTPLTVADVADRAGISRQTFYKYFPTLGDAVLHTAQSLLRELEAFIVARLDDPPNAREELLARFSSSFEYSRQRPELTRFFSFYDHNFRAAASRRESDEVGEIAHRAGNPFHDLFRRGQRDGSIDPALPADVTYLALVTSLTGTSQQLLVQSEWTTGTDARARAVHDALIGLWREALTPKERR